MLYGLDLFSGIGGIALALAPWVRTVAYCEYNQNVRRMLLSRMGTGDLDLAPIWDDVRTLRARHLPPYIDIVSGGFPCQDISSAGAGAGLGGERSGLFFEIVRLLDEMGSKPPFLYLENVPALTFRGLDRVASELAGLGYLGRWGVVSASYVGANHKRSRIWIACFHPDAYRERCRLWSDHRQGGHLQANEHGLNSSSLRQREGSVTHTRENGSILPYADDRHLLQEAAICSGRHALEPGGSNLPDSDRFYANDGGLEPSPFRREPWDEAVVFGGQGNLCDPYGKGLPTWWTAIQRQRQRRIAAAFRTDWWETEPTMGRVVDGFPFRVDMLRALGNSVLPRQGRESFKMMFGLKPLPT